MLQKWMDRASLRQQLIVGVAVVHALLMTIFVVDLVFKQRLFLREQMRERNTAVVQRIARHATTDLLTGDIAALQEIISGFSNYPDIKYTAIVDPAGKVLAHSEPRWVGQYMNDSISRAMLAGPRVSRPLVDDGTLTDTAMPIEHEHRLLGWVRFSTGMKTDDRGLQEVAIDGSIYAVGAIILGIVIAVGMARETTRRLYELLNVAQETRAGRRDLRAQAGHSNEIGLLAGSFNDMLDALSDREAKLQRANSELEARVAARTADLQQSEETQRAILEQANDAFVSTNVDGKVVTWNGMAETIFGWPREEALGRSLANLIVPDHLKEAHLHGMARYLATGEGRVLNKRVELTARRKDGSELEVELSLRERWLGEERFFDAFLHDITERKALEKKLAEQALQDILTGLPNRRALMAELPLAMARAERAKLGMAVLFLDLDGFKGVNDAHGHDAGDEVLREFSRRLKAAVRLVDRVARLAGDEFVVIAERLQHPGDARLIGAKIMEAAQTPFKLEGGHEALLSSSIGVCHYEPGCGLSADQLLSQADNAMYGAKHGGKGRVRVWGEDAAVADEVCI